MMNIPGYKIDDKLYKGRQSVIYRGRRLKDDKPVILKILRMDRSTPEEIARFKREFEITSGIDAKGVVKALGLDRFGDNLIMVLEDFGGRSLEATVVQRTGQLRSERDRAEMYFNLAGVIMVALDRRQRVQQINKKGCEVLGYPQTEIIGKNWFDTFIPERDRERTRTFFRLLIAGEIEPIDYFENPVATRTGEERLVAWHNTLLRDRDGKIHGTLSSGEDITQRKRAEDELKAALHEKEILLKEIHHRVKNNLQIASSLLSLQAFKIDDEQLIEVLNDNVKRLNSMAEIHKLLYETESFANIPFDRYLKDISANFFNSHSSKTAMITLKPSAENIFMDIAKAVPCALIINELLSNAFKYAFPGGRPGEVEVLLYEKGDRYTLIVRDNGVGVPGDLDINTCKSLGMIIVKNLVTQLKGDLHLDRKKGAVFTVTFPKS